MVRYFVQGYHLEHRNITVHVECQKDLIVDIRTVLCL